MVSRRWLMGVGAAAIVAAAAVAVRHLWPGDEARLARQLRELARLASKSGPEPLWEAARRADRMAAMFDDAGVLAAADPWVGTLASRGEIRQFAMQTRARLESLGVGIYDLATTIQPGRLEAVQTCAVRVQASSGSWTEAQARAAEIRWRKGRDGWRIVEARTVDVIRPLAPSPRGDG